MSGFISRNGHCFTAVYNRISPILRCEIEISPQFALKEQKKFIALWDTGASCSLITPKVINRLGLAPFSASFMSTPSDNFVPTNIYRVNFFLPNNVIIPKIEVFEGISNGFDVIIGMDVIGLGDFAVSNYMRFQSKTELMRLYKNQFQIKKDI